MSKIWKTIQQITFSLAGACLAAVIVLIFINVVCRYITKYSIPWCEEATRYMFIAVIFLTLNIMVSQNAALRVDIIDNYLKGNARLVFSIIQTVLTAVALAVFTFSGIKLMEIGKTSMSPALHLPMYLVYAILPLGYFLALIEVIHKEVVFVKEFKEKGGEA